MVHFYCPYCLNEIENLEGIEDCMANKYWIERLDWYNGHVRVDEEYDSEEIRDCDDFQYRCPDCGDTMGLEMLLVLDDNGNILQKGEAEDKDIKYILERDFRNVITNDKIMENVKRINIEIISDSKWNKEIENE